MGLWTWITGVDTDAEQARGDAADAQLAELNRQALDSGHWTKDIYDQAEANRMASQTGDVNSQIGAAFVEGAKEGAQNIAQGVNDTLSFGIGTIFKAIPWSVWLIAAVVLFVWMGGLTMLKGRLKTV